MTDQSTNHFLSAVQKRAFAFFAFMTLLGLFAFPAAAHAFSVSSFLKSLFGFEGEKVQAQEVSEKPFPFLAAVSSGEEKTYASNVELQVVDGTSLAPSVGILGNAVEAAESAASYKITTYTVRRGDTLPLIAKSFGVSPSTIRWANNISKNGTIKEGQELVILPVSGVIHTVKKGDTIASIAKKYGSDPDDILNFNGLDTQEGLAIGTEVIVPDGELSEATAKPSTPSTKPSVVRGGGPELIGYFLRPVVGAVRTQGIHGYNGIDFGASRGTPVLSSAGGTVIVARNSGWNGGYGNYIVISHANGTQTLYAHLNSLSVVPGQSVSQGEVIGTVGNTGRSTGPHLHFEVRGAKNPF